MALVQEDAIMVEATTTEQDMEALKNLAAQVPTGIDELEKQIKMGGVGKTAFDAVGIFMGADDPEIAGMLQRTNFQSFEEEFIVSQVLMLAKYGCRRAWVKINGVPPPLTVDEWEIPELKQLVLWIIQGRVSIDGKSRTEAKEAIQGMKVTLGAIPRSPLAGP